MTLIPGIAFKGREWHLFEIDGDKKPLCNNIRGEARISLLEGVTITCNHCQRISEIIERAVASAIANPTARQKATKKKKKSSSRPIRSASKRTSRTKPRSTRLPSSSRRQPAKKLKKSTAKSGRSRNTKAAS